MKSMGFEPLVAAANAWDTIADSAPSDNNAPRDPEAMVATLQIGLEYQSGFFSFFCCFRRSFWHP
jgi:hypothetical protein